MIYVCYKAYFFIKHNLFKNKIYCSVKVYQFYFGVSSYSYKGKLYSFIVKEMFSEVGFKEVWVLKNPFPITNVSKGHAKIFKTCMGKFNVTTLNKP